MNIPSEKARLHSALEMQFGAAAGWDLKIRAAHAQLMTLQSMAPSCYRAYMEAAVQAIYDEAACAWPIPRMSSDFLQRAVNRRFPEAHDPEVDLAWSITYGLEILLGVDDYRRLIRAALEACAVTPEQNLAAVTR